MYTATTEIYPYCHPLSLHAALPSLSGTFTANFGAGELTGSIQNSALKIDIGTADIFGSAIAGFGTATATNPSTTATLASNGDVSGQFFGSAAQALAGIV